MDLWKVFEEYGPIADIFIARKLGKNGRKFGFIRFVNIKDEKHMEKRLSNVWIGNFHLFVAIARFGRDQKRRPLSGNGNGDARKQQEQNFGNGSKVHGNTERSYASLFKSYDGGNTKEEQLIPKVVIEEKEMLKITDVGTMLLGKVRDINLIENLATVCKKEGFLKLDFTYVGGTWVWIDFPNAKACIRFQQHADMKCYFLRLEPVSKTFLVDDRVVWVEIEGLPLGAWTSATFKKVAGIWGETVFEDNDEDGSLANGRVCIKMKKGVVAGGRVRVEVLGKMYDVRVKELGEWVPDIRKDGMSDREDEVDYETDNEEESVEEEDFLKNRNNWGEEDELDGNEGEGADNEEVGSKQGENNGRKEGREIGSESVGVFCSVNVEEEVEGVKSQDGIKESKEVVDEEMKGGRESKGGGVGDSESQTPSRPPGFGDTRGSRSDEGIKGKRSSEVRRQSFSATSVSKRGQCSGSKVGGKVIDGADDFSLIHGMSRVIGIGSALGHDMGGCKEVLSGIINGLGGKRSNP